MSVLMQHAISLLNVFVLHMFFLTCSLNNRVFFGTSSIYLYILPNIVFQVYGRLPGKESQVKKTIRIMYLLRYRVW